MAIETNHPSYDKYAEQWCKLRDVLDGQEAVHAARTKYLPRLSGQTDNDYKAYLKRTMLYGATSRTLDGLSGMVFRKSPAIIAPDGLQDMLEDITLDGLSIESFAEQIIDDGIAVGRAGILVDSPTMTVDMTVAQAEAQNLRPFLRHYTAESIYNWQTESVNNKQVLTQLRLIEHVIQLDADDEFGAKEIEQRRVLDLNDSNHYRQRIYRKKQGGDAKVDEWVQHGEEIIPLKKGKPLDMIPFYFVGVKNGSAQIEKPPLIDMCNVNLSHYITTADLEHGAHFTGLPTAVITGHSEAPAAEGEAAVEYKIGSSNAWVFPEPESTAFYLEFNGQGLEALEKRCEKKEQYMAHLGARMLTPEKRQVESSETAQIHRSGENSVLSSLTMSVSRTIEEALTFAAEWWGVTGDISFKLNNEFLITRMTAQELLALLQVWQSGAMAKADVIAKLKEGEVIAEDRTQEDIDSENQTDTPFTNRDFDIGDDDDE